MNTFLLAMCEVEHDKRSWRRPGLFAASIILTLCLNASLREQASLLRQAAGDNNELTQLFVNVLASSFQIIAAISLLEVETPRGDIPSREALGIITIAHIGSVFLQSYLLSLGNSQGYLAASFSEPILAMFALWIVTSNPGRPHSWVGLLSFTTGCCLISMSISALLNSERTCLIQGLSCFAFILRNIVTRHLICNEKVAVSTRGTSVLTGVVVSCGCIVAFVYCILDPVWIGPVFCALTSTLLSVGLIYFTANVLKSYNVVFASAFRVLAILLEALVMTSQVQRPDWITALIGLSSILLGVIVFVRDWTISQNSSSSSSTDLNILAYSKRLVNTHEQYTRVEFLLFSSFVVGVIFYVFQPKLSQRDLHTLSYVGLDKVIRRLLSVDLPNPDT